MLFEDFETEFDNKLFNIDLKTPAGYTFKTDMSRFIKSKTSPDGIISKEEAEYLLEHISIFRTSFWNAYVEYLKAYRKKELEFDKYYAIWENDARKNIYENRLSQIKAVYLGSTALNVSKDELKYEIIRLNGAKYEELKNELSDLEYKADLCKGGHDILSSRAMELQTLLKSKTNNFTGAL